MKHPQKAWAFAVGGVLGVAGIAASAAQQYTFSSAGNVPVPFATTVPVGINLTRIVGFYTAPSGDGAYIQTGSRFITPVPQKGAHAYLSAINGHGVAVDAFCTSACGTFPSAYHGYTYDLSTHAIVTFDFPGVTDATVAYGINDLGDIVGGYCPAGGGCPPGLFLAPVHGYLLSNGQYSTLDYPDPRVTGTSCNSINDAGTIVGWYNTDSTEHGFMNQIGTYSLLDFPGAMATFPNAINNLGVVAGVFENFDLSTHGFTYANGVFAQVDVPPNQALDTGVSGINDGGVLVGSYVNLKNSTANFKAVPKRSAP